MRFPGPSLSLSLSLIVAGVACGPVPPGSAQQAESASDRHEARIDSLFAPWAEPGSPGAAVAVVREGEVVFSRGYGLANLEYEIPITPRSVFHVASISKQFTAFAAGLLAQDGRLSLDDDIRVQLPEMPDLGETVTIRHLIHHTSGIRDQWELLAMAGWRLDDVITKDQILTMMRHQRELNFSPGEDYLYSNMGYTLLAEIVERVAGQPFPEFAEERIFRPLGMHDTHFHDDHRRIVPNRAYSYSQRPDGGFQHAPLNYANAGATSLFTTVEDLARWDRNFDEPTVGGPALIRLMHTRGVLNGGREIAYAFALMHGDHRGLPTVGHGGADAGYRTSYVRFPDHRFAVVVFSNLGSVNPARLASQVAEIFLEDRMTPPSAAPPAPRRARPIRVSADDLARFAGEYADPATDQLRRIELRDDRLMLVASQELELVPLAPTRFRLEGAPLHVEFEFDAPRGAPATALREIVVGGEHTRFEPTVELTAAQLAGFAGTYSSDELGTHYDLVVEDGRLIARHRRHQDTPLTPTFTDRFAGQAWWFRQLHFSRDEHGRVDGFRLTGGRVRNLRFERQPHPVAVP